MSPGKLLSRNRQGIMRIAGSLVGLFLVAVAATAQAACRSEFEVCAAGSPWLLANNATIRVEFAGTSERALLALSFPAPNNVLIDREHRERDSTTRGKVLFVDGQIMLTKDVELEKGREIYALDGPLLFYQLAISLLAAAFPEGPEDIKRRNIVDLEEGRRGILVETSSASGFFGAPWRMKGSVNRESQQSIAYVFDFEFTSDGTRRALVLSGVWGSDRAESPDPDLSLKDWNVFALEPRTIRQGGTTARRYEAVAMSPFPGTLGGLRDALRNTAIKPRRVTEVEASHNGAKPQ